MLFQTLSRMNYNKAKNILGPQGEKLLLEGGKRDIDIESQVKLSSNVFRLNLPDSNVSIIEDEKSSDKMRLICSSCDFNCVHKGAALSLILEEKSSLGLAEPPKEDINTLELTEDELIKRELLRRQERAEKERFIAKSIDREKMWSDYIVTSKVSGKSYRVALRGWERGESFCTCPDFRKNTLGTCKHIMYVIKRVRARFPDWKKMPPFNPELISVYLLYGKSVELRLQLPRDTESEVRNCCKHLEGKPLTDIAELLKIVSMLTAKGVDVVIYPDAEQYIALQLHKQKVAKLVKEIKSDPCNHPLRFNLLGKELLPYQLEGISFVVENGRAVLADDMGLGKTIQGIGASELLARYCDVSRVLIICPASVKSQWISEISEFCDRSAVTVVGTAQDRVSQYHDGAFFTVCNYEQVLRDLQTIEQVKWDFIILDEGQRIKNWETKTSRVIKGLRSRYALVLSGTPLENRLEELYSVIEFIDDRRLGPDFRFEHQFRIGDSRGRLTGYKNLDQLRKIIKPVLLRRTREMVLTQLPERHTEIVRVVPFQEQLDINNSNMQTVSQIVNKKFITEMDLLRLQKALLACRMASDSTFLVNKEEPAYSSKLQRLHELIYRLIFEKDRKIVLFSEWTTMLGLIEKQILKPLKIDYVRLDGSVPQKKRSLLVKRFKNDQKCRLFITTNAGSTGLNLQCANTVINVDLPWNPAVLEQRIGRVHRMGQKSSVQIYLMVTEQTLEEKMLLTLATKKDLYMAALDQESDADMVNITTGVDDLKKRLEILLGVKPPVPVDESERIKVEEEAKRLSRLKDLENSGGKLVSALFSFAKALIPDDRKADPEKVAMMKKRLLDSVITEEDGSFSLKIRLPDQYAIDDIAETITHLNSE